MSESVEKEIILSVRTDTSQATTGVNELKTKMDGLNNTPIDKPFRNFKTEIREATTEAKKMQEQFGNNSTQFREAAKRVAELKDRFGEFNDSIKAFNPDNKMQALVSVAKGATGAIQGVTGAMTFFGGESEKVGQVIARLQGLMALSNALNSVDDIKNAYKNFSLVIADSTILQKLNATATAITGVVMKTLGVEVETTATSFKVLKGAIISTGIGALVIGLIMLVQNFDKVKESMGFATKGQQALNDTMKDFSKGAEGAIEKVTQVKEAFNEAKTGVISKREALKTYNETLGDSLGRTNDLSVAEKNLTDKADAYIKITALKAQANALFAKSGEELAKGITAETHDNLSWWDNMTTKLEKFVGGGDEFYEKIEKKRLQTLNSDKIKEEAKKQVDVLNKAGEDLLKQAGDLSKKSGVKFNEDKKNSEDELKAFEESYKNSLKAIQSIADEAHKKLAETNTNDRQKELTESDFQYKEKIKSTQKVYDDEKKIADKALKDGVIDRDKFNKRLGEIKNQEHLTDKLLLEVNQKEKIEINKKYDKQINDVLTSAIETKFEKEQSDIIKKYDDLLKIATTKEQKIALEHQKFVELIDSENVHNATVNVTRSETNLIKTERNNTINDNIDDPNKDTADSAKLKIIMVENAKREAENEAFELKKLKAKDDADELAKIEQEHQTNLTKITKDSSTARKEIDKKEKEAKENNLKLLGSALGSASELMGKTTVAGKAFAIAQTTIDTYQSATAAYKSMASIPVVGPVLGGIAAAAVKMGLDNVQNIVSVPIPNAPSTSTTSSVIGTAPIINAQSTQQQQIQDVRVTNTDNKEPIRAYITNSDLQTNEQKTKFINNISTF